MISEKSAKDLVNEILLQCVKDYVEARKRLIKYGYCAEDQLYPMLDKMALTSEQYDTSFFATSDKNFGVPAYFHRMLEIEYFFLSDWFAFLTNDQYSGEVFLAKLRKIAVNGKFDEEYQNMINWKRKVEHPTARAKRPDRYA